MGCKRLLEILRGLHAGEGDPDAAAEEIARLTFTDLGFARVDHHRGARCGFPEVIFCEGKRPDQVRAIAERILEAGGPLLATRAGPEAAREIQDLDPLAEHHEAARVVRVVRGIGPPRGLVTVVSAGTADIPVAEEARLTAEMLGARTEVIYDCGVAGIHRLLAETVRLEEANALVVVAGMEGALASVVGGLVDKPVFAVPTSIGYGASFGGVAPLLTMLNSCAAGVSVVNIDNGFGAGYSAGLVNRLVATEEA